MKARSTWLWWALGLLVLVAAGALARKHWFAPKAATATASAASSKAVQALDLSAADLATAQMADLSQSLALSGSLKAVNSAFVKARLAAEVRELSVREGDRVVAGQLLGRLDTQEVELRLRQAEDQTANAQAQLDIAQRTLANNEALVGQGFISRTALDTSINNAAAARASLQAARATADLQRKAVRDSEIRAPIAGWVSQRLAQPGERVPIDTRLIEIVDLSRLEMEAAVAPEDVLALRVGQAALVQVDGLAQPLPAKVARVNPSAQAGTRSVLTYLQLDTSAANAQGLRQGLFARATVKTQQRSALVVPASAVRLDQSKPYVLVVEAGAALEKIVTLGARGEVPLTGGVEAAVEVTDGLAAGAVVLRGTVGNVRGGTAVRLPGGPASGAASAAAPSSAPISALIASPNAAASAPR